MYITQSLLVFISNTVSIISISLILLLLIYRNTKLLYIVISMFVIGAFLIFFKIATLHLNNEFFIRPDKYEDTCKKLFKIDNIFSDNLLVDYIKNIDKQKYKLRGFPSMHTTISTSIVTLLYLYYPKYRNITLPIGIIYLGLVGYSRVYLNCHKTNQVIGGYILGVTLSIILYKVTGKINKNILR